MTYTLEEVVSLAEGMKKASEIIREFDPDYVLAPITGAIPFIDLINIVDPEFKDLTIEYVPSTSKFENLIELTDDWFYNFLTENHLSGETLKLISVDEVVSGTSAYRNYQRLNKTLERMTKEEMKNMLGLTICRNSKNVEGAVEQYKQMLRDLKDLIVYKTVGIQDEKGKNQRRNNKSYRRMLRRGIVKPVDVKSIITMDNADFCPVMLKFSYKKESTGRPFYLPEIESFNISPEYLGLLQDVAKYVGVDPSTVSPRNMSKISGFTKYLSPELLTKE